ncbi:uncharacterized protein A4U43_C06F18220 [Asparagus officinalis]|uniref:Uncharacterized protein n=1 Tax=Asparagus officinalis TaxID=4686 RepID=A0A5P1ENL6_ASPOF|nr:uncharacterized protein A4U43_C06F18220 [Asparagus officinalis]
MITGDYIHRILRLPQQHLGCDDVFIFSKNVPIDSDDYTRMTELLTDKSFLGVFSLGYLKLEYILLSHFLKFDLYLSVAHTTLSSRDVILLHWIARGQSFDPTQIIFVWMSSITLSTREMVEKKKKLNTQLVHFFLITLSVRIKGFIFYLRIRWRRGELPCVMRRWKTLRGEGKGKALRTNSKLPTPSVYGDFVPEVARGYGHKEIERDDD